MSMIDFIQRALAECAETKKRSNLGDSYMYNICITIEQDLATLVGTLNLHKLHKIVPRRLYIRPFDSYQLELPMMNPNPILPSVGLEGLARSDKHFIIAVVAPPDAPETNHPLKRLAIWGST